jgi:hypothetical protein
MTSLRTALFLSRWLSCSAVALAATVAACSGNGDDQKKPCPTVPAFKLTLHAASGPLPDDTVLKVKYGGGVEEFKLADATHQQEVVLCDIETEDAGLDPEAGSDAGVDPEAGTAEPRAVALSCKVWAQGAATVTATGTGYPEVQRELEAKLDGKCIKTVPVDLLLGELDAGN